MRCEVELHKVRVCYDAFCALDGIDLCVQPGEALGIVGPNGSGKSTLLKTIAGLLQPERGSLCVFGTAPRKLPRGTIAYVPQVEAVDWAFPATVSDVVAMGRFAHLAWWQRFGATDRALVEEALEAVGMASMAGRHIAELSGGQQQRAFIARALAQQPRLLLLDEPTTGVDATTEEAMRVVVRAVVARGTPVLMTTHDLERVDEWFDRLMVLDRRTLALGTPAEVAASGAYAAIREHTHTHGHLRVDHDPHEGHEAHPEVRL